MTPELEPRPAWVRAVKVRIGVAIGTLLGGSVWSILSGRPGPIIVAILIIVFL